MQTEFFYFAATLIRMIKVLRTDQTKYMFPSSQSMLLKRPSIG